MTYSYPTDTTHVSDDFADHVERGSVNPGTDYTAAYGSDVVAVAAGVVTDADGSPNGSGGRTVHVDNDDGTGADYLHLSALSVSAGQRVAQGQRIGFSGASGNGSNWYYGPHLHISFRRNHAHGYGNVGNLDFDALMRSQTHPASTEAHPITEDDDMATKQYQLTSAPAPSTSIYFVHPGGVAPVRSVDPEVKVLERFADAMNAGDAPVLTEAQYKLVDEVMQRRL